MLFGLVLLLGWKAGLITKTLAYSSELVAEARVLVVFAETFFIDVLSKEV